MDYTKRIRITVGIIFVFALSLCVLTSFSNYSIVYVPALVFFTFFVVSALRDIDVTTGEITIGMNADASFVVGAAVICLSLNSPLAFLLAVVGSAIYLPNIQSKSWSKLIMNGSNEIAAGCLAYLSLVLTNFSIQESTLSLMSKIFLAAAVFELVNYAILAVYYNSCGYKWRESLYDLQKSLIEVLPLAIFSGLLGKFYFDFGAIMLVMFVVPLFFGRELAASYARMSETQKSTLETLTRTLEAKDKYTAGHVERVAKFAKYIGEEFGYGPKRLERLRQAALLHDVGKLIVPSTLLNKPGKLTEEEFKVIQRHEYVTIEILKNIDFLSPIAYVAGGDHNTMDGKKTRKLEPFIVSACDAFDAMTSSRSYRKALSMETAFEELNKKGGKQFHPKVVEALIRAIESRDEHYGDGYETNIVHADAPISGIGSAGLGDLEEAEILRQAQDDKEDVNAMKRSVVRSVVNPDAGVDAHNSSTPTDRQAG